MSKELHSFFSILHDQLSAQGHRRLVLLAGEAPWCQTQAVEIIDTLPGAWCWLADEPVECSAMHIPMHRAASLLGGEWLGVVYDARSGFDADAFGAVAGTVRAGGLLVLLTPPLGKWGRYPDPQRQQLAVYPFDESHIPKRFLTRLAIRLSESEECLCLAQGKGLPSLPEYSVASDTAVATSSPDECATEDQRDAVEALSRVAQGHRRRPLVLVSDRGRGKSTALGLASARLLLQGIKRIVVTAPRMAAVEVLFHHAAANLTGVELERGLLRLPNGAELRFVAPDRLLHESIEADLVLVDEAAAIPPALLEQMLQRYARIAFATTVHGYEGTGRGFDIRFRRVLDRLTPQWRRLTMQQPIRWAEGDPLESQVFKALLLDAEPAEDESVAGLDLGGCVIERVERDRLLQEEALLSQIFGLLVLAHYRTSPSDLRNLLDGPNLQLYILRHQQTVLATALVAQEGAFEPELAEAIYAGQRRLRGNLLPQSLASHAGLAEAPLLKAARVMRIAVHPARQGEGLGQRLIEGVASASREAGADYIGASFGADARLLDFWRRCACLPVRVGLKRETASGAHAVMVMRPLSSRGESLYQQARERYSHQLPTLLSEPLADLEAELVVRLLSGNKAVRPTAELWRDIRSFGFLQRDYGNCLLALRECLGFALSDPAFPSQEKAWEFAVEKVLQHQSWPHLVEAYQLAGRKQAVAQLRSLFQLICQHYGEAL